LFKTGTSGENLGFNKDEKKSLIKENWANTQTKTLLYVSLLDLRVHCMYTNLTQNVIEEATNVPGWPETCIPSELACSTTSINSWNWLIWGNRGHNRLGIQENTALIYISY